MASDFSELSLGALKNLPPQVTAVMSVDLSAIAHNYHLTRSIVLPGCEIASVLKADAYGIGMVAVARELWAQGCRHFFVAYIDEGIALRHNLPHAAIYILCGVLPYTEALFTKHNLIPVLVHRGQIEQWRLYARQQGQLLPALLHIDTGMRRNGLSSKDIMILNQSHKPFEGIQLEYIISHLTSSDESENPHNREQLNLFKILKSSLPPTKASLSNSCGLALGSDYHFDLVRPGIGLLGYARPYPCEEQLRPCLIARARIVQINEADEGQTVGYNMSYRCERPSRLATLGIGYCDGLLWNHSNRGVVWFDSYPAPIVGRVSMDFTVVDITDIPESYAPLGSWATLFDTFEKVDKFARQGSTFHYELLTSLGSRYYRQYFRGKDSV